MKVERVKTSNVEVNESVDKYVINATITVKEDGSVESVQGGTLSADDKVGASFTSWGEKHLNFDCSDVEKMTEYIAVIKEFLANVRAKHFTASVEEVE